MHITLAEPTDAPGIRRVARTAWHEAYDPIIGPESVDTMIDEWYTVDRLEDAIADDRSVLYVARGDSELVGFAEGLPTEDGPAETVLARIYVDPSQWGNGIGRALFERVASSLRTDGYKDIWLGVMAENDVGRAFYESLGFTEVATNTTELGGTNVEERILKRDL